MKREATEEKRHSMRWKIMGVLLICWLLPFSFLIGVLGVYIGGNHGAQTAESVLEEIAFDGKICMERLNSLVLSNREATYDGTLLHLFSEYEKEKIQRADLLRESKNYLTRKYQRNELISSVYLWFEEPKEGLQTMIYNESAGGTYAQGNSFWKEIYPVLQKESTELETKIGFKAEGDALYLYRNLVDSHYIPRAMLVFRLNTNACLESLLINPLFSDVQIEIGDRILKPADTEVLSNWIGTTELPYQWKNDRLHVSYLHKEPFISIGTYVRMQPEISRYPFTGYPYLITGMVLLLIPMLFIVLFTFRHNVTEPVMLLHQGGDEIRKGNLGFQIEAEIENSEFSYLAESFNRMSLHLKQQFDKIYSEEVALREAKIMALQSNINPHFMNNTLEIINWEARLAGNERVSEMISALSVMLDAAMDRRKRPEVSLAEELGYVNSYLFITKERLGDRIRVEMHIPEELKSCLIPRLILQPILENAVEHGIVPSGRGSIEILAKREEAYLVLLVINDGVMTQEDREKIRVLLDRSYNYSSRESSVNLGIANVNQRLKTLYGESCGLTIEEQTGQKVVSKLVIPLQKSTI